MGDCAIVAVPSAVAEPLVMAKPCPLLPHSTQQAVGRGLPFHLLLDTKGKRGMERMYEEETDSSRSESVSARESWPWKVQSWALGRKGSLELNRMRGNSRTAKKQFLFF